MYKAPISAIFGHQRDKIWSTYGQKEQNFMKFERKLKEILPEKCDGQTETDSLLQLNTKVIWITMYKYLVQQNAFENAYPQAVLSIEVYSI